MDMPSSEKPRERLIEKGASALSNGELIAVLLGAGYSHTSVLEISQGLMRVSTLRELLNKGYDELVQIKGIGRCKACLLLAVNEIAKRLRINGTTERTNIETPEKAIQLCPELAGLENEHLVALYLNSRHRLIQKRLLSMGNLNTSIVDPREVYKHALRCNAYGVILLHNHPSGDPEPSDEDIEITRFIADAGKLLNIRLVDHIIIGEGDFVSLSQRGSLTTRNL